MDKIVITGYGVKAPGVSNIDQFKDVLELGICTQEILHGRGHNGSNIVCGVVHEDLNMISGENYKRYPSGDGFKDLPIVTKTKYQTVDSVAITNHGVSGNNTCLLITKEN
jgi:hypothetical protein